MAMEAARLKVTVGSDTSSAEQGLESFSGKLNSASQKMAQMGGKMTLGITAPLVGIAGAALNSAADFEQSMNVMEQVTSATSSQMAAMQAQALELGAATSFSAGEAADAMLELGKAGMDTEDIMASIGGVMDLAAAGGVNLAEAASLTAATLNAFHLEASESTRVADLLAATANASAADISDLGQGMQQAGFAFSMANQPVENLAASLAILTNVGLTGSDAGTALKNAFMRMMNPTKEAAGIMNELGISFYDASGNMKMLPDIIGNLNVATAGMTAEQRDAALATIFLSDGMKAMIPLMDQGKDGFNGMVTEVSEFGAAGDVADARMKGLSGSIEYLSGSVESFLIGAALPFLDTIGGFVRGAADLLSSFSSLPQPVINAGLAFLGFLAAIGPIMLAVSGLTAAFAFLLSPIGLVIAGVALLGAAWALNIGGIQEITATAFADVQAQFNLLVLAMTTIGTAISEFGLASVEARDAFALFGPTAATLGLYIVGAAAAFQILWASLTGATTSLTSLEGWQTLVTDAFGPSAVGMILGFAAGVMAAMLFIQTSIDALVTFLTPSFARVQEAFLTIGTQLTALGPQFQALLDAVQPIFMALVGLVAQFGVAFTIGFVGLVALGANLFAAVITNMGSILSVAMAQMTLILTSFTTIFTALGTGIKAVIDGDWTTAWDSAATIVATFGTLVLGSLTNLGFLIMTAYGIIKTAVTNTFADMGTDVTAQFTALETRVQAFWTWLTGLSIGDAVGGIATGFGAWVTELTGWEPKTPAWVKDLVLWEPGPAKWVTDLQAWEPKLPAWVTGLILWEPGPAQWVTDLTLWEPKLPMWVTNLTAWEPKLPAWITTLTTWEPSLPAWVTNLTLWEPKLPMWVTNLTLWEPKLPMWVTNILAWEPKLPAWVTNILAWEPKLPAWVTSLTLWEPALPAWVTTLTGWIAITPAWAGMLMAWVALTPGWATSLMAWIALLPDWVTTLTGWVASKPTWVTNLLDWIPTTPPWLNSLLGWSPPPITYQSSGTLGTQNENTTPPGVPRVAPLRNQSFNGNNNGTQDRNAGITMNVNVASMNSDMDIHSTYAALARQWQQRARLA